MGTGLLTIAVWAADMASGINPADSDWFLQLLVWVGHGDALYSDRFYGVMPLAVWAGLPGVLLIGPQIAVVKGLNALAAASAATLAAYAARRLGVGRAGQALIILAGVAYLILPSSAPYKPMAYAAQVGALAAMAVWLTSPERRRTWPLLLAGSAVGISIASKHTVGALTLAACLVVLWLTPRAEGARDRLRSTGVLLAPAIAIPALALLPVLLAGDLGAFWRYAISKGEYTSRGSFSYFDEFRILGDLAGFPPPNLHEFLLNLGIVAAPLALIALAVTARRQGEWLLLASFSVVAIASSYPRADLLIPIPVLSVALAWSVPRIAAGHLAGLPARVAVGLVGLLLAGTAYATLMRPAYVDIREGFAPGGIENHAGAPVPPEMKRAAGEIGGELATVDHGQNRTFVLAPDSGFIYLASDVHDPTRADFPFATTFRSGDRAEIERRIASGEIARVCLGDFKGAGRVRPWGLEAWVRSRLSKGEHVGPPFDTAFGYLGCTIYRPAAG